MNDVRTVLVESSSGTHFAWVGVRLLPALDEWTDADESLVRADVRASERAWLAGQWTTALGTRWELRYIARGNAEPLLCVLLGRVHGANLDEVRDGAWRLLRRLTSTPRHVRAEPIDDLVELRSYRDVPRGDPRGALELRKPLRWSGSIIDIAPLTGTELSWQSVWFGLAALRSPTTVGILLQPYLPPAALLDQFRQRSERLAAIGRTRVSGPTWQVEQPGDHFAASAAATYRDAVRRYARRPYRMRITISSAEQIDRGLAELLAATAGHMAVCPTAATDLEEAWHNKATMSRGWLADTYRQGAPSASFADAERILTDLVDTSEAAAAFRLPYEAPGQTPLFGASATDIQPRRQVFVSYVHEDLPLVERLVDDLTKAGCDVWFDRGRTSLPPGSRWRILIKKAIENGAAFLLCCSANAYHKPKSFMYRELNLAAEHVMQMPSHRTWLIPVRFDDHELPDMEIGANQDLNSLQSADFSRDWQRGLTTLIEALNHIA
jgi:hypothetical protein